MLALGGCKCGMFLLINILKIIASNSKIAFFGVLFLISRFLGECQLKETITFAVTVSPY